MLLDFSRLIREQRLPHRRIVHVGGNEGEEGKIYAKSDIQVVWFEPRKDAAKVIRANYPKDLVVEAAAGRDLGYGKLRLASNGQSSSLREPKLHLQFHPEVTFSDLETVPIVPVDLVVQEADGLVADVQGYEDEVLLGAIRCVSTCAWVYLEVNRAEVFEGCPMVENLDAMLTGFRRIETVWACGTDWGDAFWVKR